MKNLVVINFNEQNSFTFNLNDVDFIDKVEIFNYATHQVGKYFNKLT